MESTLNLGSGYPTLVALSFSKKMYTVMRGAFSKNIIEQFLIKVLSGRESFTPFTYIPKLNTVTAWDGKDKKP